MDSMSFSVPEQQAPGENTFDIRPQAVQRWVAELPMGDMGEAARRLYMMLQETNRLKLTASLRAEMLEMVAPAVDSVHGTLLNHYTGLSFPLPQKSIRVAQFADRLLTEMVIAYQSVLDGREGASWLFRKTHAHLWVRSIHRIMVYLERIIADYRIIHRPYPAGVWMALHQLYQQAHRYGWVSEKVAAPGEVHSSTIEQEYKRALLFSLLEPQMFRRSQMGEVQATMRCWIEAVRLGSAKGRCKEGAAYCIHADQDAPYTAHAVHCGEECDESENRLLLDMSDLSKAIEMALDGMGDKSATRLQGCKAPIARETLETLGQCWRPPQGERRERLTRDKVVQAAIGMSAIHALLQRKASVTGAEGSGDRQVDESLHPLPGAANPTGGQDKPGMAAWDEILYGSELGRNAWAMDAEEKNYQFIKAKELNYTETGRSLAFDQQDVESLQVGELVGFRESEGAGLQLSMVRWLQDVGEQLHVGLMRLAAEVEPVMVLRRQEESGPVKETGFDCLLGIGEDHYPLLFLPYLPGKHTKSLYMAVEDRELPLTLHDKMVLSPLFEAFHFAVLTPLEGVSTEEAMPLGELNNRLHRLAHSGDGMSQAEEDDFSDVWNSL